ncbi:MAG: DUF362 domain-containing protein [Bacillota bacterium]|nr:DUF362 domain-containing protein [Bacillota bacterium]
MAGSKVFFTGRRATSPRKSLQVKLEKLIDEVELNRITKKGDFVAVKLHFGERGLTTYLNPVFVRTVVDKLYGLKAKPFLTDTNTLYVEARHNAVDHLRIAMLHGFSYATIGAPIIIADGLKGHSSREVSVSGKHFQSVKIAEGILDADSMVVLTHVKGHNIVGMGGAIKNLSMGCSSRAGKHMMHASISPEVIINRCKGDGACLEHCPVQCISLQEGTAFIRDDLCIGCGECVTACPHNAIRINGSSDGVLLQEKMAEFALGAVQDKKDKVCFFNFLMDITPHCDCHSWSDSFIVPDIGILASFDPVAIDQASIDLINRQQGIFDSKLKGNFSPGEDKFHGVYPGLDYTVQLRHAEEIGLGNRSYEIFEI